MERAPREYAKDPWAFGHADNLVWKTATSPAEATKIISAQLQHRYAIRIRDRLRKNGRGLRAYAAVAGTSYDRATKVLRGITIMRLDDIAAAEQILGNVIDPPLGGVPAEPSGNAPTA